MKKFFKIIMQLHAEEGGAPAPATTEPAPVAAPSATEPAPATTQEPAPAAQQPASTEPAATPAPAPAPDYKVVAEEGDLQVVVDADGRRHLVDKSLSEPEPKQNTETEPAPVPGTGTEPQTQPANPAPAAQPAPVPGTEQPAAPATVNNQPQSLPIYTPQELSLAIQMGMVDESRIPPSMAIQYGQFKEKQAQQQAIAANQQQAQQTPQPNEAQQRIAYMKEIENAAREVTLKQLGLTEDDLKDAEYANYADNPDLEERVKSFDSMLAYNRQQIINDVQAEKARSQQQAAARAAINQSVNDFTNREKQTEPKFEEISIAMLNFYKTVPLPYEKAERWAKAVNDYQKNQLTEQSAKDLQEYYDEVKKAIYAKANNLSTTPKPVVRRPASVESPGTGQDIPKPAANPKELRDLDYMGRIAWIRDNI